MYELNEQNRNTIVDYLNEQYNLKISRTIKLHDYENAQILTKRLIDIHETIDDCYNDNEIQRFIVFNNDNTIQIVSNYHDKIITCII